MPTQDANFENFSQDVSAIEIIRFMLFRASMFLFSSLFIGLHSIQMYLWSSQFSHLIILIGQARRLGPNSVHRCCIPKYGFDWLDCYRVFVYILIQFTFFWVELSSVYAWLIAHSISLHHRTCHNNWKKIDLPHPNQKRRNLRSSLLNLETGRRNYMDHWYIDKWNVYWWPTNWER